MAAPPKLNQLLVALDNLTWSDIKLMAPHLSRHDLLSVLANIEQSRPVEERALHAFQAWLDRDCVASWNKVISALRVISKNTLAKDIEAKYSPAKKLAVAPRYKSSSPPTSNTLPSLDDCAVESPSLHSPSLDCTVEPASSLLSLSSPQRDGTVTVGSSTASPTDCRNTTVAISTATAGSSSRYSSAQGDHQAITEEATELQEQFVTVLTHTKICLMKKAMMKKSFLIEFKVTLTTLPLSKKHQHLKFLEQERDRIMAAKDIDQIFEILKPYWNYVDYSFLQYLVKEFGSSELKKEMGHYILQLEAFEKKTSVKEFNSAVIDRREFPSHFSEVIITKARDPEQCSLYEVRQFKNEVVNQTTLHGYTVYLSQMTCSSVEITLAFPQEAAQEILESLNRLSWIIKSRQCIEEIDTVVESRVMGRLPLLMADQTMRFKTSDTSFSDELIEVLTEIEKQILRQSSAHILPRDSPPSPSRTTTTTTGVGEAEEGSRAECKMKDGPTVKMKEQPLTEEYKKMREDIQQL